MFLLPPALTAIGPLLFGRHAAAPLCGEIWYVDDIDR
jgi:hypothetical protein